MFDVSFADLMLESLASKSWGDTGWAFMKGKVNTGFIIYFFNSIFYVLKLKKSIQ